MTAHMAMNEFLAGLNYIGRCPSWMEYENGSPAEQRAIPTRWSEIILLMGKGDDRQFKTEALKLYSRYCAEVKAERPIYRAPVRPEYESAQAQWYRGEAVGPDTSDDAGL